MIDLRPNIIAGTDFVGRDCEVARFEALGKMVVRERRPAALVVRGPAGQASPAFWMRASPGPASRAGCA